MPDEVHHRDAQIRELALLAIRRGGSPKSAFLRGPPGDRQAPRRSGAAGGDTRGKSIVQQLVGDLQEEFPGIGGFSASNLWRMKSFFEAYAGSEKLAQLVREIGRGRSLVILQWCSDPLERQAHLIEKRYEVSGV